MGEEYTSLQNDIRLGTPTAVFGISDAHKYLIASLSEYRTVYVASDFILAGKAFESISALSGKKCVLLPPKDEAVLYKDALSKDALYKRLTAIHRIMTDAEIIVCSVESLMQLVPLNLPSKTFTVGEEYDYQSLPAELVRMGYSRTYTVDAKGCFAVRGDILDIYPVNCENPLRIDFFGDTAEKIRPYDAVTGERLQEIDKVTVIGASDVFVGRGDETKIKNSLKEGLNKFPDSASYNRARAISDDLLMKLEAGVPFAGLSFVMPLLGGSGTLFDLIEKNSLFIFDECKPIDDILKGIYKEHLERVRELSRGGEAFEFSRSQLLSPENVTEKFKDYRRLALQTFTYGTQFFQPLKTYNLRSMQSPSYVNAIPQLIVDLKHWLTHGYRILVFTGSIRRHEMLTRIFSDEYLPVYPVPDRLDGLRGISVTAEELAHGLVIHGDKLVIIGSGDLYTKSSPKRVRKRRGDVFSAPEIGDFAVHEKHGIGRITGTKKIETTDGIKEYVAIEYKGGDVLYVPVEQMDVLSKYVGDANPQLSKIGGADFGRVVERVKRSIRSLAFDLKKLYAERSEKKGFCFPAHEAMMREFEDAFIYEETEDQLVSAEEIKADMCSEKVMDRLLCGDVGFGKTEVALRAVYLCVLGGKQAALMCPSTVLSEQHFNTALERFADFGVRVEKLNRFRTPAQQAQTLKRLANGDIDFIIGTHRLLSDDVKFYDLGLLILDEEQRFGVEHKEKIKNIKNSVDCLTMTATPIPRTLHMSLSGIRDISTINTPPQKRLPVQTYVVEESETLIRDACIKELSRGGQVFILYNRVESISSYAGRIAEIIPEGKVCYAHGRMEREKLENSVFSFYRGEKNILVTTTIIENGIDLPNANTIIVIDADRLGISQLYQLRGRVGRGSRLASAYFMFKSDKVLTFDATERLKAIMQFTELGSGFKLALRDLEIRGAGNVLGAEQHGHMDKVGYELYSKLLKEELTGEKQFSAELEIKATAYIPEAYIESGAGRMDCYKQIAEIRTVDDYKRVCHSIEDNFGPMPDEVLNLLIISVLKSFAAKFNVKKISVDSNEGMLELPSVNSLKNEGLKCALDKFASITSLSMAKVPLIIFKPHSNPAKTMLDMTKFLKFALSFA